MGRNAGACRFRLAPGAFLAGVLLACLARTAPAAAQSSSTTSTTLPVGGFQAVCGDPSFDNRLTATDAALALRAAVGLVACDGCRCDVDYSGAVTATDSNLMLKVSVGDALSLSCPACTISDCGTPTTTLPRPNRPRLVVTNQGSGSGTVVDGIDGIECGCDCSNRYPNDTKLQLTATADADSFFTAWGGAVPAACLDSTEPCILRMRRDRSVTATFLAARLLTVTRAGAGEGTIVDDDGTIDCGTDCSERLPDLSVVVLRGNPTRGSYLVGWSGSGAPAACAGSGPCVMQMGRDRAVTGTFELGNTLDVSKTGVGSGRVTGPGIRCGSDCTETYAPQTAVTLLAVPDSASEVPGGVTFGGWSGNVPSTCMSSTSSCALTMDAGRKVTATFGRNCPTDGPIMKSTAGGLGLMLDCSDLGYVYRQRRGRTAYSTDGDDMVIAQGGVADQVTYEATVTGPTLFTLRTASLNGGTPVELGTGSSGRITDDGSQLDLVVILTNGERFDFLGATYLSTEKLDSSANLKSSADGAADPGDNSEDPSFARLAAALGR